MNLNYTYRSYLFAAWRCAEVTSLGSHCDFVLFRTAVCSLKNAISEPGLFDTAYDASARDEVLICCTTALQLCH